MRSDRQARSMCIVQPTIVLWQISFTILRNNIRFFSCHLIRISELELPAVAGPRYELLARLVGQQLQQELPQLDRARALETATTLVFIVFACLAHSHWLALELLLPGSLLTRLLGSLADPHPYPVQHQIMWFSLETSTSTAPSCDRYLNL